MMGRNALGRMCFSQRTSLWTLAALSAWSPYAVGQMHKVAAPEQVVRAVGVYEWTGDMAKPNASRLIPVSLFVDDHLEDAGVYLARPVPLALDTGTVYELERAGLPKGTVNLEFARHLVATDDEADVSNNYDDGWFGYGIFHGPPKPRPVVLKKPARPAVASQTRAAEESDRPTFAKRPNQASGTSPASTASSTTSTANPPSDDPDRPHLTRKSDSSDTTANTVGSTSTSTTAAPPTTTPTSSSTSGKSSPDDNSDRPQFAKRPNTSSTSDGGSASSGQGTTSSNGSATGTIPNDDPDRPTLKKRTPAEARQARKQSEQSNVQSATASLNDDPDRPKLERGRPAHPVTTASFVTLKGLPAELHQMVAVSDAKTRESHDFARPWEDNSERTSVLTQMEALARAQLAAYDAKQTPAAQAEIAASDSAAAQQSASKAATTTKPPATTSHTYVAHKTSRAQKKTALATPELVLVGEDLHGYTLSYGGAATFVYSAHTAGSGAALRYVTIVAQKDALGALKPAIINVTDQAHLDRTPRMRLVDVVDAEASNRASILFELRGENEREFALYRVIAAHAEQTFLTGTTE